jgi:predicted glutamine amidotransferase
MRPGARAEFTCWSKTRGSQLLQFTDAQEWALVHNGAVVTLSEAEAAAAKKQRPARALRKQMKRIIDTLGLKADNTALRIDSAIKLGRSQKAEFIPALEARLKVETDKQVLSALQEALAISWLANGEDVASSRSGADAQGPEFSRSTSLPGGAYASGRGQ